MNKLSKCLVHSYRRKMFPSHWHSKSLFSVWNFFANTSFGVCGEDCSLSSPLSFDSFLHNSGTHPHLELKTTLPISFAAGVGMRLCSSQWESTRSDVWEYHVIFLKEVNLSFLLSLHPASSWNLDVMAEARTIHLDCEAAHWRWQVAGQ